MDILRRQLRSFSKYIDEAKGLTTRVSGFETRTAHAERTIVSRR